MDGTQQEKDYTNTRWIIQDVYEGQGRRSSYLHSMCRWNDVDRLHLYWTRSKDRAKKFYTAREAFHARREIVENEFPHEICELKILPIEVE